MTAKKILIGLAVGVALFSGMRASADRRELDLFLGAKEEYNDNIFFSYDDPVDDFITTLSGGLKFLNQTERTDLFLSGIVERLIYSSEKDLNSTDQYYKGRFGYKFTPRLGAKVDAAYSKDSRPDRDVAESGLILSTVPRQIQNYGAAVDYALTEITDLEPLLPLHPSGFRTETIRCILSRLPGPPRRFRFCPPAGPICAQHHGPVELWLQPLHLPGNQHGDQGLFRYCGAGV